jgi:hypothetical protein
MGLGTPVTFGRTEHQAVHKVWGRNWTRLGVIELLIYNEALKTSVGSARSTRKALAVYLIVA